MVVRALRDIHNPYFLAGTVCLHFYPQKIRFYASINVFFAHKSNNIILFRLKNINKFVYMQFLSYIRHAPSQNKFWVGSLRKNVRTFVQTTIFLAKKITLKQV